MRWLRAFIRWNLGYNLQLFNWSTSQRPLDSPRKSQVHDVLMPNKRYSTVVFWRDNPGFQPPPRETPCTNLDLPLTSGSTTRHN